MRHLLKILTIFLFILTLVSCSEDTDETSDTTTDTTAPTIAEITAITTPTTDTTPDYTFSSDEAGTITYGGSCSSSTTTAVSGNNTITLVSLSTGVYSNCTLTVTDTTGNVSSTLALTSFTVAEQMGGSMQGVELSLSTAVTTLAGTGSAGSANGTGTSASFKYPYEITTDGTNLYVADAYNDLVRQIVISTGVVTTIAGTGSSGSANGTGTSASFYRPEGITTDGTNLYVADYRNHLIRKIVISTGVVTTVAGTGSAGSANGTGTSASFSGPTGITTDGTNLYVTEDGNSAIRKIVIDNLTVTTVAGGSSGSANGTGTSASFSSPQGITTDGTNLYVADQGNHLIRKIIISTGVVTTIAGTGSSGSANGTGTSASFADPYDITIDDGTNLYVADYNNHLVRKIVISTGVVTTIAGTGSSGSANGTGTSASFYNPIGITTDGTNLYVVDYNNHLIRQIE